MSELEAREDVAPEENAPVSAGAAPPSRWRHFRDKYFYLFLWCLGQFLTRIYFRMGVRGWSNVPKKGPVLFVSNHISHLDPPILGIAAPRRLYYLAKSELFTGKKGGAFLRMVGGIGIKRGASDRAALRTAMDVLKRGDCLIMFPEGTRSETGEIGEAQRGVSMLINQMPDVPVVPVHIRGTYESMGPGKSFPRPVKVKVSFGKAFRLDDLPSLPTVKKLLYHELGKEIIHRILDAESG